MLGYDDDPDTSYIARYLPTGKLDGTFGSGGKRTIPVDSLFDLVLQPDGKLLALGYHEAPDGDRKFALYRLLSNGAPDTTFNNGGVAWLDFGGYDVGADLALLPDGRILAFGWSGYSRLILARLWPDGTTFDTGGQQAHGLSFPPNYQPGYRETVNGMALQPNGDFLVAGQVRNPEFTRGDAFVTRFKANGLPDTSFGANGSAFIFGPDPFRAATAVAVQPDGKIVIAGYTAYNKEHTAMDFMVARFLPNGGIDLNFGAGGVAHVDFAGRADKATTLALAPDGKIVVAGPIEGTRFIWGVARLTASGQLDGNFNGGGKAYVDFPGRNGVTAVLVQPDRKIILGGYREANPDQFPGDTDFALARLTESGALDPSFGPTAQGIVTTQIGGRDRINALALAPNGFIYAGGYREIGVYRDFALMQYQPNGLKATCAPGAPCTNWPTGKYLSGLGGDDWINALAWRADGQLVAAGCLEGHFAGVQLRTDGDPIPPQLLFNSDFVGSPDCAKGVAFVGANRIVMTGDQDPYPFIGSDNNIALARFETTVNTSGPTPIPAPTPNPTRGPVYLPIIMR
ncbi:MAG: hypothetical protein L6R45_29100 [Anaerolineae bacterium]|nr:hypothetical protein [Anaerolineae bacterium]